MRNLVIRACVIFLFGLSFSTGLAAKPPIVKPAPPPEAENPPASLQAQRPEPEKPSAPPQPPRAEPGPPPPRQQKENPRRVAEAKAASSEFTDIFGLRFKNGELFLAAFTAGLFLGTLGLWRSSRKLIREGREFSERKLRAYLHVTRVEFHGSLGGEPKFFLEYANLGQTPAYEVADWCVVELRHHLSDLPFLDSGEITHHGDLGPGQKQSFVKEGPRQFTSEEINDIISGVSTIHFYGAFAYRDAFGKLHRTQFRRMLVDANGAGERIHFGVCSEGERSD
ncbi:hypothetical protein LG047_15130 [Methylocystis sp. WRRC1]|uniref:hypothetical protein n=1 Tax=Methylocystis sp. WRRC1 TaxID=1732014 RepID=UPI001D13CF2E|nr:hypothetical protein [Methylocystis sp. WRRC1]MCC3246633.1 hypothetical protein [Methylocystis sp. WRRC1]